MTTSIRQWSESAAGNNATVAGINFAEGQLPSTVNNSARELMAQVRQWYHPDEAGWIDWGATASIASQTVFKLAGDQTAMCVAGRRIRLRGGSVTARHAGIVSASYTSETTVTITNADGSLSASMSIVGLAGVVPGMLPTRLSGGLEISGTLSAAMGTFGGSLKVSATLSAGAFQVGQGTAGAPAISFAAKSDTGLYLSSASDGHVAIGSCGNRVLSMRWDSVNATSQFLFNSATSGQGGIVSILDTVGNFIPLAIETASTQPAIVIDQRTAAPSTAIVYVATTATSSTNFAFALMRSRGGDTEFSFRGDGTGLCDGSWTGGGADFAEMREWDDRNQSETDRAGITVVLTDDGRIRPSLQHEDPIGVVSVRSTVIGGNSLSWPRRYELDDFGRARRDSRGARSLDPEFRAAEPYVTRDLRSEWAAVGILGFIPVRNDQTVSHRWVRSRRISDAVTEWLVR